MNNARGIMMLLSAGVAVWKGVHILETAMLAYALAALALAMAIWHLTRPGPRPHR